MKVWINFVGIIYIYFIGGFLYFALLRLARVLEKTRLRPNRTYKRNSKASSILLDIIYLFILLIILLTILKILKK